MLRAQSAADKRKWQRAIKAAILLDVQVCVWCVCDVYVLYVRVWSDVYVCVCDVMGSCFVWK